MQKVTLFYLLYAFVNQPLQCLHSVGSDELFL